MKAVKLIDTSILCELLKIPGKSDPTISEKVKKEFVRQAKKDVRFILPLATVVETGNHIAQNGDGNIRRAKAQELVDFVNQSLEQESPFLPPPFWQAEDLRTWMARFPDAAMREIGLGDVSIQRDLERAKELLHLPTDVPIEIWSKDCHLSFQPPHRRGVKANES